MVLSAAMPSLPASLGLRLGSFPLPPLIRVPNPITRISTITMSEPNIRSWLLGLDHRGLTVLGGKHRGLDEQVKGKLDTRGIEGHKVAPIGYAKWILTWVGLGLPGDRSGMADFWLDGLCGGGA